ncbi:MAG: hypothetical protein V4649_05290 [Bacteroidota bacterium]
MQLSKVLSVYGKVRTCSILDPNYEGVFNSYVKYGAEKEYKVLLYCSDSLFKIELKGITIDATFAVNIKDRICLINEVLKPQPANIPPIYLSSTLGSENVLAWLSSDRNVGYIEDLKLVQNEGLVVYRNGMVLYVNSLDNFKDTLQTLLLMANSLRVTEMQTVVNANIIPTVLKPLIPYFKDWAISDDFARQQKISRASEKKKREIVFVICPLLNDIDAFIANFKEPMPDEAILLGNLAVMAMEIDQLHGFGGSKIRKDA